MKRFFDKELGYFIGFFGVVFGVETIIKQLIGRERYMQMISGNWDLPAFSWVLGAVCMLLGVLLMRRNKPAFQDIDSEKQEFMDRVLTQHHQHRDMANGPVAQAPIDYPARKPDEPTKRDQLK